MSGSAGEVLQPGGHLDDHPVQYRAVPHHSQVCAALTKLHHTTLRPANLAFVTQAAVHLAGKPQFSLGLSGELFFLLQLKWRDLNGGVAGVQLRTNHRLRAVPDATRDQRYSASRHSGGLRQAAPPLPPHPGVVCPIKQVRNTHTRPHSVRHKRPESA